MIGSPILRKWIEFIPLHFISFHLIALMFDVITKWFITRIKWVFKVIIIDRHVHYIIALTRYELDYKSLRTNHF